jgi:hypothetical protein
MLRSPTMGALSVHVGMSAVERARRDSSVKWAPSGASARS